MSGETESTDNSNVAISFTLVMYILYFMYIKPVIDIATVDDSEKYDKAIKGTYVSSAILFACVLAIHLVSNTIGFQHKCEGNFMTNFGKVFGATFFPWFIIMGSVMVSLLVFPGFKGAFSNVFGYYAVSNSANNILVSLIGSSDTNDKVDAIPDDDGSAKTKMADAASAIVKIIGNTSLLINQITPSNFNEFWDTITPLIKPELKSPDQHRELKKTLLENVVLKDNIGEACWYIYTMILLVTVVKSNIADIPCGTSVAAVQARMDKYTKKQDAVDAENKKKETVTYKS